LEDYKKDSIFTDPSFINCRKYYRLDEDTIEFEKDFIKDVLPLKYLDKICHELNILCEVFFVDDTGNQHTAKKYGMGNNTLKLILMYEHFMPYVIVDKEIRSSHLKINRNIKLSSLIAHLMKKNLYIALPMKYCYTNVNTMSLKINDYNCKLIKDNKTYGKYKNRYELINNLLLGSDSYHERLTQIMKEPSYSQILFHIKSNMDEPIVEVDVNGLYAFAISNLRIPKGKPKWIDGKDDDRMNYTFIIKVEILSIDGKQWSTFKKDNVYTIDNITYNDLIQYQDAKIINGIFLDEGYVDNNDELKNILAI
jgi:hypothetical protein